MKGLQVPDEMELLLRISQTQFTMHHVLSVLMVDPENARMFGTFNCQDTVFPFHVTYDTTNCVSTIQPLTSLCVFREAYFYSNGVAKKTSPESLFYNNILNTRLERVALFRSWTKSPYNCKIVKDMIAYVLTQCKGMCPSRGVQISLPMKQMCYNEIELQNTRSQLETKKMSFEKCVERIVRNVRASAQSHHLLLLQEIHVKFVLHAQIQFSCSM